MNNKYNNTDEILNKIDSLEKQIQLLLNHFNLDEDGERDENEYKLPHFKYEFLIW